MMQMPIVVSCDKEGCLNQETVLIKVLTGRSYSGGESFHHNSGDRLLPKGWASKGYLTAFCLEHKK